jgi:Holliday junction resolvase RusA-like endonuclease
VSIIDALFTPDEPLPEVGMNPEEAWPPPGAELILEGVVLGEPVPAGSKATGVVMKTEGGRKVPARHPDGRVKTFTKDDSGSRGKTWRGDIRDAVLRQWQGPPLDEPLALSLTFYGERTKAHYGTGRNEGVLKDSAPLYPHESRLADGTKLSRAFEDALNKLAWKDDRRFVRFKWARDFGSPPRVEYRLYRLPMRGVYLQAEQGTLLAT